MIEREKLIKELNNFNDNLDLSEDDINYVADFIIADRKRIVEPLVIMKNNLIIINKNSYSREETGMIKAMNESLKLAGVL